MPNWEEVAQYRKDVQMEALRVIARQAIIHTNMVTNKLPREMLEHSAKALRDAARKVLRP